MLRYGKVNDGALRFSRRPRAQAPPEAAGVPTGRSACDEDRYRILSGDQRSWGVESNPENGHSQEHSPGMTPENAARQPTQHAGLTPENAERSARVPTCDNLVRS